MKKYVFLFMALIINCSLAQMETANWFISHYPRHHFKFLKGIEHPILISRDTVGTAYPRNWTSISDSLGNLICFTDGVKIYNKNYEEFADFSHLRNAYKSIILPFPGRSNNYYNFSIRRNMEMNYYYLSCSIIDVTANQNIGGVSEPNIIVENDVGLHLHATRHRNGVDYWLFIRKPFSDRIVLVLLTKNGIIKKQIFTGNVISSTAEYLQQGNWCKFSPNSKFIASPSEDKNIIEILKFDNLKGDFTFLKNIELHANHSKPECVEFSSNSKVLYFTSVDGAPLFQFDMTKIGDPTYSYLTILDKTFQYGGLEDNPLVLTPNYDISFQCWCIYNDDCLCFITEPNKLGFDCSVGLPGVYKFHMDLRTRPLFPSHYFHVEELNACKGDAMNLRFADSANYEARKFHWQIDKLDDPKSAKTALINAMFDSLFASDDSIFIAEPYLSGLYNVTITNYDGRYYNQKVQLTVNERPNASILVIGDTNSCEALILQAKPSGKSYSYLWSDSSKSEKLLTNSSGTYWVTVSNESGCSDTAFISINKPSPPDIVITGPTEICTGRIAILQSSDTSQGNSYLWSTGEQTHSIAVSEAGTYRLIITNKQGCSDTATHELKVLPELDVKITGNREICEGSVTQLDANPKGSGYKYLWATGDTAQSIEVSTAGKYWVQASLDDGCDGIDTVDVIVFDKPSASIEATANTICLGDTVILTAKPEGMHYQWSTGDTASSIKVIESGIYKLLVSSPEGCTDSAAIEIRVVSPPFVRILAPDSFCRGSKAKLSANSEFITYLWSTGEISREIEVSEGGIYWLEATNEQGCKNVDTVYLQEIEVSLQVADKFDFGKICVGEDTEQIIEMLNSGKDTVEISEIALTGDAYRIEQLVLPQSLAPGQQLRIAITYKPDKIGQMHGTLKIKSNSPCPIEKEIELIGESKPRVRLYAGDTTTSPGANVCLPIYGEIDWFDAPTITEVYTAEIEIIAEAFLPQTPEEGRIESGMRIVKITGSTPTGNQPVKIGEICGHAMLNAERKIEILVRNFSWINTESCNSYGTGKLYINEICAQNSRLIRLISKSGIILLPNPAGDKLELVIYDDSKPLRMNIYNTQGMFQQKIQDIPSTQLTLDISAYPAGLYFAVFEYADGTRQVEKFIKLGE